MLNCISFDIEGFIESNLQSFISDKSHIDRKRIYEIEKNINCILQLLCDLDVRATFFVLGSITRDIPSIVKNISYCGHEIGFHGHEHIRIADIGRSRFKEYTNYGKLHLEDVISKRVYGFRAPDFSITKSSFWALDILKEVGFYYDSSIYPFGFHDVYGIRSAQRFIHKLPNGLIEFPLSTIEFVGIRLPFGGGGYFRLYPVWFTETCIRKINEFGKPCMLYIHPYEVGPEMPSLPGLSVYRKFRHYYNCKHGEVKLRMVLSKHSFAPVIVVLSQTFSLEAGND